MAQVGVGTNNPASSAALEITAINNDKGLLIPRLLESEKLSIESPANGLLIYQTDSNFGFYVYSTDLSSWYKLTSNQELDLIDKTSVGLGSVDNTSDPDKPISTATQTALDLKAPLASPTFTGTIISGAISATGTVSATAFVGDGSGLTGVNASSIDNASITSAKITDGTIADADISSSAAIAQSKIDGLSTSLSAKADLASPTFTGTVSGIDKTMVGLGSVDNTSDSDKPVSTATQTALDLKAPLASPTFTGTVSGIDKTMVGLGSVDNTSDADKPISTATQTAVDLKAPLASPTFTGTIISGAISATGTVSATAFVGDGSGLTGVTLDNITNLSSGVWTISTFTQDQDHSNFVLLSASGFYNRVVNIVSFTGTIALQGDGFGDPSSRLTYIEIDLPIASTFQTSSDASGSVSGSDLRYGITSGNIEASNNKLRLYLFGLFGRTYSPTIGFSGMYIIR